jgi:O-antigen/teichoic acid export membrane protein
MEFYKTFFEQITYKLHLIIFNSPPGDTTKRFIKNLSYAFLGVGGATAITFAFNILAIRYLGPVEFGKWNIIGSIAEFFVILPLWGLTTASLRYLGAEREKQKEIIGTAFRSVFLLSLFFFPLYIFLAPVMQNFLKIENSLYLFAMLYAAILVFFYLFQSFFQGLEEFKKLSFLWIISAFVFVGIVSYHLFFLHNHTFMSLFAGNVWRHSVILVVLILFLRKLLFTFDTQTFSKLFSYGSLNMLSVFAGFFSLGAIDNLMINYFLEPSAVGIYSAYYIIFTILTGKILNTFSQVFLPKASGIENIKILFFRAVTLAKKGILIVFFGNVILLWILFKFYGKGFSFDLMMASIISLSTSIYCFRLIFGNILVSRGIKGAKYGPVFALSNAVLNILFNLFLIPRIGLHGAALGTLFTVLITGSFPIFVLKKYFHA